MTDEANIYRSVGREFARHGHIFHAGRQYADDDIHSNTAENFSAILKRGVIGTYHHWSAANMHRYLAEFSLRYSTKGRTDGQRAATILLGAQSTDAPEHVCLELELILRGTTAPPRSSPTARDERRPPTAASASLAK